jgi:hypothetical protein
MTATSVGSGHVISNGTPWRSATATTLTTAATWTTTTARSNHDKRDSLRR